MSNPLATLAMQKICYTFAARRVVSHPHRREVAAEVPSLLRSRFNTAEMARLRADGARALNPTVPSGWPIEQSDQIFLRMGPSRAGGSMFFWSARRIFSKENWH